MKRKFILIAVVTLLLAACVVPVTPTAAPAAPTAMPRPSPQPSPLLGTKWKLDRMIIDGETRAELEFNHQLEFTRDNELWTDDGCNTIMVPVTVTISTRSLSFAAVHKKTLLTCERAIVDLAAGKKTPVSAEDPAYVDAVFDSVEYDIRDNELWLYYPDSKANALVYRQTELALINGTLIDGTGADPIKDAVLIIQGERIAAAGPRSSIDIPEGAQLIDVQGATLLPGFFNAHVHGAYNAEKLAAWAQEGVTTVRDLGAYQWPPSTTLLARVEKDKRYARLISGGIFITPPGGYPIAVFGGNGKTISTTAEAPLAVNELLDQGADVIKISLESGQIFGQAIPMLTLEQVRAIVTTAHHRGTRVSAHATVTQDLKRAIDEGVDDMAHMVVDPINDDLIKAMIERDMVWVPTIELWKNVGHGQDTNVIENLHRYVAAGGQVALGTDFEGYYTPFQLGMPMKEIGWMSEAGMTPMQIIVAATKNAARVCNVEKGLGTLETGKIADVLIVKGDPLQDLQILSKVLYVIHKGEVIREP
jgi:imidazolonepropionase-like amidohydrolase